MSTEPNVTDMMGGVPDWTPASSEHLSKTNEEIDMFRKVQVTLEVSLRPKH